MARIAYFDPYSGASGDMALGALLDGGVPLDALRAGLANLGLAGWALERERVSQHGMSGTRARVVLAPDSAQPERDWRAIRQLLTDASLPEPARAAALAVFEALAVAEAQVHGTAVDDVHFHEVGGVDAIVDIVGVALGLHWLGVERVYSGPPALGRGFARARHGVIPVPAPATARLLALAGAPSRDAAVDAELLTPTGAALLTTLAEFTRPVFRTTAVGYGFGARDLPWPNALRLWIGETDDSAEPTATAPRDPAAELLLETNIDDMNPEFYELLVERLFAAGALDVFLTPIVMKRGRPATQVSAIVATAGRAAVEAVFFENSTTFGLRASVISRSKSGRRSVSTTTRWGDVRLKLKIMHGRVLEATPEYADCLAVARSSGAPLRLVYGEAQRLGEAWVGQNMSADEDGPGA